MRNLDFYRRRVRLDSLREQVGTLLAVIITALFTVQIIACWFPHLLPIMRQGGFWIKLLMGLVIPVTALVALLTRNLRPRMKFLYELGSWIIAVLVSPAAWIFPNIALYSRGLLAAGFMYQGRFDLAGLCYSFIVWPVPKPLLNLLRVDRAEIEFYKGDFPRAIAQARAASEASKASYETSHDLGLVTSFVISQSMFASLLAMHGLLDESVAIVDDLIKVRPEIEKLATIEKTGEMQKAQALSYIAMAATHTKRIEMALECSAAASAAYAKGKHSAATQPLEACISEHWATAALISGDLDVAETQARKAIKLWEGITSKTGFRLSEPHRVLGCVLMKRGSHEQACEELALAAAIRDMRTHGQHPLLSIPMHNLGEALYLAEKNEDGALP